MDNRSAWLSIIFKITPIFKIITLVLFLFVIVIVVVVVVGKTYTTSGSGTRIATYSSILGWFALGNGVYIERERERERGGGLVGSYS